MSKTTKIIFLLGIILVVYGYLCRGLEIYFFWDSKSFGWIVLFIGLFSYLIDINRSRRKQGKKTIWVKIGIGGLLFGLLIAGYLTFAFKDSDAYQAAIEQLTTNSDIKDEVGNIKGFGLIPTGEIRITIINGSESGSAAFLLTIKGDKKYKDVVVRLKKTSETNWTITSVE